VQLAVSLPAHPAPLHVYDVAAGLQTAVSVVDVPEEIEAREARTLQIGLNVPVTVTDADAGALVPAALAVVTEYVYVPGSTVAENAALTVAPDPRTDGAPGDELQLYEVGAFMHVARMVTFLSAPAGIELGNAPAEHVGGKIWQYTQLIPVAVFHAKSTAGSPLDRS